MKKAMIIAGLIFLILIPKLKSQIPTFEFLLDTPMDEVISDIFEDQEGFIYFTARQHIVNSPDFHQGLIVKLDLYGNIVDSIVFAYPDKNVFPKRILPSENQLYDIVGWFYGEYGIGSGIVLYKMDNNLDIVQETSYRFPDEVAVIHVRAGKESNQDISVFGGYMTPQSQLTPYAYVFNNNHDSIKARYYTKPYDAGILSNFRRLHDGNYWVIKEVTRQYAVLDSDLNILEKKSIPHFLTGTYGVKWDSDTSFYMIARQHHPQSFHTLSFYKQFDHIDTTGHLFNQWRISDTIDIPAMFHGIDYRHKDTIFMGGSTDYWIGLYNPWPSWMVVIQTDSLLNIRWERFYGGDAFYMMSKIIATHDGGCLVAGIKYDYNNTSTQQLDIVILKLDEQGLITGIGESPSVKISEAIIYPNPGSDYINIRVAAQHKQPVFELFDLNGKCVIKENLNSEWGRIGTSFLKSGTYLYRISGPNGLNETGKWLKF